VEVRGGEEEVVGEDRERRGRRHAREQAERHGDGRGRGEEEQADVERARELGVPGGVGLVERVAVDVPVQGVGEERPQAHEHGGTG
jgi:hypothetical protein